MSVQQDSDHADVVAYSTGVMMYFNVSGEILHSLFAILTAVMSYAAIIFMKYLIKKYNDNNKQDK